MRLQPFLWVSTILLQSTGAIFADEAFHVDYHHALLGIPLSEATFFHKPQTSSNASLLYSLSDKGVLGAINPKDGTVLWRQALNTDGTKGLGTASLATGERDGQITTGYGNTVNCWDALDGKLKWQYDIEGGSVIRGIQLAPAVSAEADRSQDVIVLAAAENGESGLTVSRVSGDGSGEKWRYSDSSAASGSSVSIATSETSVFTVEKSHGLLAGNKAKIVVLDIATGKESSHYSVAVDPDPLTGGQSTTGSCSGYPFLISSERPYANVKFNSLGSSKLSTLALDTKDEDVEALSVHYACGPTASAHFLIHVRGKSRQWAEVFHINKRSGEVSKAYTLPATEEDSAFAVQSVGAETYIIRTTDSEISLYSTASHGHLGRWARKGARAGLTRSSTNLAHAAAEVVSGKTGFAVRVAETSAGGELSLIRNGEVQWSRPEMLAYATIAAWVDDGPRSTLIEELEVEASVNPVTAYIHRLKRHLHDLNALPQYLQSLITSLLTSGEGPVDSKQRLIGDKMVIIGTSRKDLVAVDAGHGGIVVWQSSLAGTVAQEATLRSLYPTNGRTMIYLSDGSLAAINTTNGAVIEYLPGTIPASKVLQIPAEPAPAIVKIDPHGKPHLANDFSPSRATEGNVIVTLSENGNAFGWTIGQNVQKTWTLRPKASTKFTSAISRASADPVASIGKVLGDRSVLYKYISPNLALLIASSPNSVTIYLVDAVTGAILHTSSHEGKLENTAIPAVISENWCAYAFTSQDPETSALSTQLIISELYESPASNDRGLLASRNNYSSFAADAGTKPYVISQAFTLSEPISTLAVTQTVQGITTRQLLAALPNSNAIVAIPREILNARRPVDRDPTRDEQEEGLFRYSPVLELDPKQYLTHSREVFGVQKLLTAPSLLESTSFVFAFGHDIFGSQVVPSGAFDVLGKGFNRVQLLLTIAALFASVAFIRPMVRKKMVEGQW
jgi:ER membrane protein complex subunit 1